AGPAPVEGPRRAHAVETGRAATAWVEVAVGDTVAFGQRLAGGVRLDVGAEPLDHAAHLVTERLAAVGGAERGFQLTAPDVKIGATDPAAGDPDQRRVGLDLGYRVLTELEVGVVLGDDCYSALHAGRLLSLAGRTPEDSAPIARASERLILARPDTGCRPPPRRSALTPLARSDSAAARPARCGGCSPRSARPARPASRPSTLTRG